MRRNILCERYKIDTMGSSPNTREKVGQLEGKLLKVLRDSDRWSA